MSLRDASGVGRPEPPGPLLGELLLQRGLIGSDELRRALLRQERLGGHLGTNLLESEAITEAKLLEALGKQRATPTVSGQELREIGSSVLQLIPPRLARRHLIIPFRLSGRTLHLAATEPGAVLHVEDEIRMFTSCMVRTYIGLEFRIREAIQAHYGGAEDARLVSLTRKLNLLASAGDATAELANAIAFPSTKERATEAPRELLSEILTPIEGDGLIAPAAELLPQNELVAEELLEGEEAVNIRVLLDSDQPTVRRERDASEDVDAMASEDVDAMDASEDVEPDSGAIAWQLESVDHGSERLTTDEPLDADLLGVSSADVSSEDASAGSDGPTELSADSLAYADGLDPESVYNEKPVQTAEHLEPAVGNRFAGLGLLEGPGVAALEAEPPQLRSLDRDARLEEAALLLQQAELRDDVADVLLSFCAPFFERRLLLARRRGRLVGWRAEGDGIASPAFASLDLRLDESPIFSRVQSEGTIHCGPAPEARRFPRDLRAALASQLPEECVVLPIWLAGSVGCYLWADNVRQSVSSAPLAQLQRLGRKAGLALQICVLRNRIRSV